MDDKRILVIIPTYNERSNIEVLILQLIALSLNPDVLIVDDNSPDGTAEEVRALQKKHKNIHLLVRDKKRGLASAYREGFRYALQKGYDIVVQMDADLSHDPAYLPRMLALLDHSDAVIASRYIPGGDIAQWSLERRLLSAIANRLVRLLLRIPIHDTTSGFKCLKQTVLRAIAFDTIASQGYSFQIETGYRTLQKGFKVIEYPIVFQGRKDEESKMSISIIMESLWRVLGMCCLRMYDFRRR